MDLSQVTQNGLWPKNDRSRNEPYAQLYQNAHPTPSGSMPLIPVDWPISNVAENAAHPFPQIVKAGELTLYFGATTVYSVTSAGVATQYTTYNANTPASTRSITTGGQWHVVVERGMWLATNGACLVYLLPSNVSSKVYVADASSTIGVLVTTLCSMNGALVLGGVSSAAVAETFFTDLVTYWRSRAPMDVVRGEGTTFSTNWLIVGPPGGGENDVTYVSMLALLSLFAGTTDSTRFRSTWRTWIDQGLLSFVPLSTKGAVKKVLAYGENGLMVYSTEGVYHLQRRQDGAFTEDEVCEFGVPGRGAAVGNKKEQGWITAQGLAFKTQLGVGVTPLYGESFLTGLTMTDVLIASYDSHRRWFWFCDTTTGWCVTDQNKWSETKGIRPISLYRSNELVLSGTATKDTTQDFVIKTCTFDGGEAMKRQTWGIGSVNCGSSDNATDVLQVALSAKMELGDSFTDFAARSVDRRGRSAEWNLLGVEFAVKVLAATHANVDLSHLSVDVTNGPFSMRQWL